MIINPINQPTNQLVRPSANGGSGLRPSDTGLINSRWQRFCSSSTMWSRHNGTGFVLHWANLGLWFTGSPQDKATLDISYFLTRYKEATIVLKFTSAKYMPPH